MSFWYVFVFLEIAEVNETILDFSKIEIGKCLFFGETITSILQLRNYRD